MNSTLRLERSYRIGIKRYMKNVNGLNYSLFMNYDHVNTADEVEEVLRFYYKVVTCCMFGISKTLSLYRVYIYR